MTIVNRDGSSKEMTPKNEAWDLFQVDRPEREGRAMQQAMSDTVELLWLAESIIEEHMPEAENTVQVVATVAAVLERRYQERLSSSSRSKRARR